MSQPQQCPECGGNCDPECGRHPSGCLFSGVQVGYWAITARCQLDHPNVERMKARLFLASFMPVKVLRAYENEP